MGIVGIDCRSPSLCIGVYHCLSSLVITCHYPPPSVGLYCSYGRAPSVVVYRCPWLSVVMCLRLPLSVWPTSVCLREPPPTTASHSLSARNSPPSAVAVHRP